jgi:hypothetical protein
MKMEQTECSEMLAYKIQTLGNYPEESTQQNVFLFGKFLYYTSLSCGSNYAKYFM